MKQEQVEKNIKRLGNIDKEDLVDSICLVDFFNKVSATEDMNLIIFAHKEVGHKVVEVVNYWHDENSPVWDSFMADGLFPMENPNKQIGDIVKYGNNVGIIRRIEDHCNHKLFIVHTTDGNDIPFIARL